MKTTKEKMVEAIKNNIQSSGATWDEGVATQVALDVVCEELSSDEMAECCSNVVLRTYNDGGGYKTIADAALKAAADKLKNN